MSDRGERMVTIEDAPELHLPHENTVAMIADRRDGSERSLPGCSKARSGCDPTA